MRRNKLEHYPRCPYCGRPVPPYVDPLACPKAPRNVEDPPELIHREEE